MTQIQTEILRLTGGKRMEGAAPGIAVLTAPLHPAHGREEETFLMVLDLNQGAPSRLYREIREASVHAFWTTPRGITAALRKAAASANRHLFQHNLYTTPEQRCYGSLSCAALKTDEFFLAQTGPACALIRSEQGSEKFFEPNLPPLGMNEVAEVQLTYLPIFPDDILILASEGLARFASDDALERILSLFGLGTILDGLEQVGAGEDFAVLVVGLQKEDLATEPVSSSVPPRRRTATELVAKIPSLRLPKKKPPPPSSATPSKIVPDKPPPRVWDSVETSSDTFEIPHWEPESPPPVSRPPDRPSLVQRLQLGNRLRGMGKGLMAAVKKTGQGLRALVLRALPGQEKQGWQRPKRVRRPDPPENPQVMAGIAVAILVIVALVTLFVWSTYGSVVRRERVFSQAQQYAALALQAADPEEAHHQWENVLVALEGMEGDPDAASLLQQAQEAIQQLDKVIIVDPYLLWDFGPDIAIKRLVTRGQDIFVLGTDQQAVFQLTLDETGARVVNETLVEILRTGQEHAGQQVSTLVDAAWNRPGGEWTTDGLVVLDTENRLWVYDPAWIDTISLLFLGPIRGESRLEILVPFEGRLYLLDAQANQVWRYLSRGGGYPDSPEPYFALGAPEPLDSARDLAVDGNIYILLASGNIIKYFDGEPQPFEITGIPDPAPNFVSMAIDPTLTDGSMYLADTAGERLVILDANGVFRAQLRAAPGTFSELQSLTLDDAGGRIFFVTGGRLYVTTIPFLP